MILLEYRPIRKGALLGVARVKLDNSRPALVLNEVKLFRAAAGFFTDLGSRPLLKNGQPVLDNKGAPRYERLCVLADRDDSEKFTLQLVSLIREKFPGVLR